MQDRGSRADTNICSHIADELASATCQAGAVRYRRMPIEVESPEQLGYDTITNNLSESSVADRRLSDLDIDWDADRGAGPVAALDDLLLRYGDHLGDPVLREAVAAGGDGLRPDDVIVTPGAAAALFATATSLLEPGDHAVVVRTNYATNLETPRAIGADLEVVDLAFDDGWRLDLERLAALVRPGTTRLISVTCPHNPTGTMLDLALVACTGRARRVIGRGACWSTRRIATSRMAPRSRWRPRCRRARSASRRCRRRTGSPACASGWAVCRDPRARRDPARGQGTDRHLRRHDRRGRSRAGCWPIAPGSCRRSSTTCVRGSTIVRTWMREQQHLRVDRTLRRRGRPRAVQARRRDRHRPLLRSAARRTRNVRRPRALVRGRRPALPPRLRLADRARASPARRLRPRLVGGRRTAAALAE